MTDTTVKLTIPYYPTPDASRALSGGFVYVGDVDTDPEIVGNQKTLSVLNENGTTTVITQPANINTGGQVTYGGVPVTLLCTGAYSIKVLNSAGTQEYYIPNCPSDVRPDSLAPDDLTVVADSRILGNIAGAASACQELTATQVRTLINVEDGATADQSDAEIKTAYENNANTNAYTDAELAKVGFITVTQAVNLDTIETNSDASKVITDYITVTGAINLDTVADNQIHTGDVTGSKALTIAAGAVDIAMLSATGTPSSATVLTGDNTWTALPSPATISDTAYTRAGWNGNTTDAASKNAISDMSYNMVRYEDADTGGTFCIFSGPTNNTTNTGNYNFFSGVNCGQNNTSGSDNLFKGVNCGTANTIGARNIFMSRNSGTANVQGDDNIGIGIDTLKVMNHADADKNCAFGNYSLDALTQGYEWVAVGYNAATAATTGFGGISIGSESGVTVTTADDTLSIGRGVSAANVDNGFAIGRTNSGNAFMSGRMIESGGTIGIKATPWYENVLGSSIGLSVNGSFSIEFTNNTTITLRGRGSDSTTRTGTITLS